MLEPHKYKICVQVLSEVAEVNNIDDDNSYMVWQDATEKYTDNYQVFF